MNRLGLRSRAAAPRPHRDALTALTHATQCDLPAVLLGVDSDGYVWVDRFGCHAGHSWSQVSDRAQLERPLNPALDDARHHRGTKFQPRLCLHCGVLIDTPQNANQTMHVACRSRATALTRRAKRATTKPKPYKRRPIPRLTEDLSFRQAKSAPVLSRRARHELAMAGAFKRSEKNAPASPEGRDS